MIALQKEVGLWFKIYFNVFMCKYIFNLNYNHYKIFINLKYHQMCALKFSYTYTYSEKKTLKYNKTNVY